MAEDASYTEHRAEIAGLRKRPDGALRSGNFQYPSFPFRTPQELLENRVGHQQIVIVGGGLAGLTAAVDLGVRGIPCVLLDDNNTVSLGSRSIAQGKRTMEIFTRLGISQRMPPKGISWSKGNTLIQDKLLYSFDLLPDGNEKYNAFLASAAILRRVDAGRARKEFPHVDIRWTSRVVDIGQDAPRRLRVETPEGSYAIEADWVIACDGVRSTARKALGIPFEGDRFVDNFVICDVKMVFNFPPQRMFWFDPTFDKSNISLMHQQPDSIWRVDWQLGPDDDPEVEVREPERVNNRLATMFGPDVAFETQFASIYSFEVRRVQEFPRRPGVFCRRRGAPALAVRRRPRWQFGDPGCRQSGVEARRM